MESATPDTLCEDMNNRMPYLEQVIQEALRMYPVAVATTRTNYLDTYLGKTLIPAGSTIMVSVTVLHYTGCIFGVHMVFKRYYCLQYGYYMYCAYKISLYSVHSVYKV